MLDEPNSSLDQDGDEALTRAILGVRARGGIAIVVAHRPSAVAGVDHLLMMRNGRQQAFGPKDVVIREAMKAAAAAAGPTAAEVQAPTPLRGPQRGQSVPS